MDTEKMHKLWLYYLDQLENRSSLTLASEKMKKELLELYEKKGLKLDEGAPLIMMEVSFISGFLMGQTSRNTQ